MQTTTSTTRRSSGSRPGLIAMMTPDEVCRQLVVDEHELLAFVNDGSLPAYDFAGNIRFKIIDVAKLIGLRAVA